MILVAQLIVLGSLLAAALSDLARREIPDTCSVAVLGAAALVWALSPAGWDVALIGLAVAAGLFAIGAGLFAAGMIGGGDVKLVAAVGAWVGLHGLPSFLVAMALLGGAVALVQLGGQRLGRAPGWLAPERGVPYGVAIALAGLIVGPGSFGD